MFRRDLGPKVAQYVTRSASARYWDTNGGDRRVDPGQFTVYVGDSSENTPFFRDFNVQ